jgi:hypothetical protein
VTAAELHPPAAQHAAAADVEILLNHDHRGTGIARRNRRRQTGYARADHHHVRGRVPARRALRGAFGRAEARRHRAGCAGGQERSSVQVGVHRVDARGAFGRAPLLGVLIHCEPSPGNMLRFVIVASS